MKSTNWDAVAASAPLDRQASVIRDGSGDLWDGKVPAFVLHWDAPPLPDKPRPEVCPDLSGRMMGRMTVVRYHRSHKKMGAQWLCRCVCGDYELRCTKVIKANADPEHCCQKCNWFRHVDHLYRQRGQTKAAREAQAADLDAIATQTRAA